MFEQAKWIWAHRSNEAYNQTIVAKRSFSLTEIKQAKISIFADSFYRLFINGQWVCDGPGRCWPNHAQYDKIDISCYLKKGYNEIFCIARHYGIGDFHGVYQRPGLLVQVDVQQSGRTRKTIVSNRRWLTAVADAWVNRTPKVSIQMEPAELYDARLERTLSFRPAVEIAAAADGPWKGFKPRDVALLNRKPFAFKRFVAANTVACQQEVFCVPAVRLCHSGVVNSNCSVSAACAMAAELTLKKKSVVRFDVLGWRVSVNGKCAKNNEFALNAGRHFIFAAAPRAATMHIQDKTLAINSDVPYRLSNPLDAAYDNPWAFVKFDAYQFNEMDMYWPSLPVANPRISNLESAYAAYIEDLFKKLKDKAAFLSHLGKDAVKLPRKKMFVEDTVWAFQHRRTLPAAAVITQPSACLSDDPQTTTIHPASGADVELVYDLGEQNLGYWQIDLTAEPGVIVDMFAVEHIFDDGRPQHTLLNRNGFRYITKAGRNTFTSLKIRSGRYVFLTFRNMTAPVHLHRIGMLESTYPVENKAFFQCSDANLERIWDISERTVKLCMTDTYLDCPLYEQTLWVGDARNESLFGYLLFGAEDIAARCIRLAAESLERYPMVGCQVPSSWDCLLPAWSFLWGLSVWEYYWQTGDKKFLKTYWPAITKNLNGAFAHLNEQGLFSGPYWNMFDWTPIDQNQKTVLHNSMLMVGAIDAGIRCAEVLGHRQQAAAWKRARRRLAADINRLWDDRKKAYPDSILEDGSISPSISQHTSFLALLYDAAKPDIEPHLRRNILHPSDKMVRVGSPFAVFYLYQSLEKLGMYDAIFDSIRDNYLPMLRAGATTVWECFPHNNLTEDITDGGPTRSHCHAWSAAPVYFITRLTLGIQQTAAGGRSYTISPWVNGLEWAKGTVMTTNGPLCVHWRREGKTLYIDYKAPNDAALKFAKNASHQKLRIVVNGKPQA